MIGNLGPTMVQGYDKEGNAKWFDNGLPDGYTGALPEIKEPEAPSKPPVPVAPEPVKKGLSGTSLPASNK